MDRNARKNRAARRLGGRGNRRTRCARVAALIIALGGVAWGAESVLPPGLARTCSVRRWMIDDGLPDSQVCGVVPGTDGALWLATARCLVRFDGSSFTPVTLPRQASAGYNEGLRPDRRGGLWLYGTHGAERLENGAWWQSEAAGMPQGRVTAIAEGPDGAVYLAQERAIYEWRDGAVRPVLRSDVFLGEVGTIRQLAWEPGQGLWVAVGEGLFRWRPGETGPFVRSTDARAEWVFASDQTGPLMACGAGVCLKRENGKWKKMPAPQSVAVRSLLTMPDGTVWMGHDAGVDVFGGGRWDVQAQSVLHGPSRVLAMASDRESNIWLATTDGLMRVRTRVFQDVPMRQDAERPGVSVLWVDGGGRVWAGLRAGGLAMGDANGLEPLLVPPGFSDVALNALYREANGTLWCGGSGGSLWTLQNQNLLRVEGAYVDDVRAIQGGGGPASWIGTRRGVLAFNAARGAVEAVPWPLDPVLTLWLDRDGCLWVGHENCGLAALRGGKRTEYLSDRDLPGRTIRALYRDGEGTLWIGGLSGLARWKGDSRFVFRRAHGLWNESVRQIAEDAFGHLWLGTADGVMRIAKQDFADVVAGRKSLLSVRTFGAEAGVEDGRCTGGVFFPVSDPPRDRLWFPTRAGLLAVEPRLLPPLRPAPEVRIVSVERGRRVSMETPKGTAGPPSVESPDSRDVRIDYAAADFAAPERVRFGYELAGPVTQRAGLTQERQVLFSRLPPGEYTFRVTACNGDGVWHPAGARIAWRVDPFLWETTGFRLWCLLAGCGGAAFAVRATERRRTRRRLLEAKREQELSRERARIARDLHDEIGAKLTRLSLLGAMAAEDAGEDGALRREIEEMADSARETHRAFDEIVWSVSPRNDTIRSLSHYICKYAEEFFAGTDVQCHCRLPDGMPDHAIEPQLRHEIFLSVKEGLHNVLKHAEAKHVELDIAFPAGRLRVELKDDGRGFEPEAANPHGNGLRNLRERMRAAMGLFSLSSAVGQGTTLVFDIPMPGAARACKTDKGETA